MSEEIKAKLRGLVGAIGEARFGIIDNDADEPANGTIGIMDAECDSFIDMSPKHSPEEQRRIATALCKLLNLCEDIGWGRVQ